MGGNGIKVILDNYRWCPGVNNTITLEYRSGDKGEKQITLSEVTLSSLPECHRYRLTVRSLESGTVQSSVADNVYFEESE